MTFKQEKYTSEIFMEKKLKISKLLREWQEREKERD